MCFLKLFVRCRSTPVVWVKMQRPPPAAAPAHAALLRVRSARRQHPCSYMQHFFAREANLHPQATVPKDLHMEKWNSRWEKFEIIRTAFPCHETHGQVNAVEIHTALSIYISHPHEPSSNRKIKAKEKRHQSRMFDPLNAPQEFSLRLLLAFFCNTCGLR